MKNDDEDDNKDMRATIIRLITVVVAPGGGGGRPGRLNGQLNGGAGRKLVGVDDLPALDELFKLLVVVVVLKLVMLLLVVKLVLVEVMVIIRRYRQLTIVVDHLSGLHNGRIDQRQRLVTALCRGTRRGTGIWCVFRLLAWVKREPHWEH
ncbi:hypothetical protein TYRP_005895 [Tyrophagus putrescentiae]|nr:hypothetical protein TYRP_005895 [Tyrophagus putrescentiae]